MNILIVDDQPTNLKLLRAQLVSLGHAVLDAANGVEALAILDRDPVDVIISDILMPVMDGYRLCYEVRHSERLRHLPFIFYTAIYTSKADAKLCTDAGGDKYLRKPASLEAIQGALQDVLRSTRNAPPGRVLLDEFALQKEYSERLVQKLEERSNQLGTLQTANEQLSTLALYDSLTGLPNRMLLDDRITKAADGAERGRRSFGLMFVDLDRFKPINDSFGHAVGDELLKVVAKRLTGCVRKPDTVARTGGDEFVVVLSEIDDPKDAALVAGKILDELSRPFFLDRHEVSISASIGISVYPQDAADVVLLKENADEALYYVKRNGRSNYRFFIQSDRAARDPGSHP